MYIRPVISNKFSFMFLGIMLLFFVFVNKSVAQKRYWHLQTVETPNYVIKGIMQDSVGLIWLATNDGLLRYDGSHIKAYFPTQSASPLITKFNRVDRIQEYITHDIICQQRNILFLFDRENEIFKELPEELKWIKDVRDYKRPTFIPNDP